MAMKILLVLAGLIAPFALAADVSPGSRLPDLSIAERGELVLDGDEVGYRAWSYSQQPGKVHVLQYLAATRSASEINKPFTDRMTNDLPKGAFISTTIVNLDEAMWGTSGFVLGELKSNKKEFPGAILVADKDGVGLKQWQLQSDSSAVIVLDPEGVVRFFKQGAMSPAEIENTLALVRQYIEPGEAPSAGGGTGTR